MISRYTDPKIGAIWTEENKLKKWLDVELAVLDALAYYRVIPKNIPGTVRRKVKFNPKRILQIEKVVKHDVIAFLTNVSENVGKASRFIHYGMTSSDVLDTGLALQIRDASDILETDLKKFLTVLKKQAKRYKNTVMVGRSHGVHAEPITFGLKLAVFYAEFERNLKRFREARENINCGQVSGAVGTFAHLDPKIEVYALKKLGLKPDPVTTQVIQRDRHAEYLSTLAIIGASLEKLAVEIRHLQKTETLEAAESFGKGQKGSSAMPHKRNPITCEKVTGMARLLRGNAMVGLENVALWHERDISHSSVERVIFPDSTIALHHMLTSMINVMETLVVYPKNMKRNLKESRGMVFSQGLMLKLVEKGLTREEAYALVQESAKRVWDEGFKLRDSVLNNKNILKFLSQEEIESTFEYQYHTKNISKIFKRVGVK